MIFDDATLAQIEAARPDVSTWLTANAGSGKTRVLTDRVARLLMAEVRPENILCLTYTKAAASEMQNRLFARLGAWAMLENDALRTALHTLGLQTDPTPEDLARARTLFARAIETPGGLKIQTIHSFCAALLRRFPLEAQVSPQFTEIEDRAAELLRAEIVEQMASDADAGLIAEVAKHYTGEDFAALTANIVGDRERFGAPLLQAAILQALGQPGDLTEESILKAVFLGGEEKLIADLIPRLFENGGNDATAAKNLTGFNEASLEGLAVLEGVFLNKSGANAFKAKIGTFPKKDLRTKLADVMPELEALMARVETQRDARLALDAAARTQALQAFARVFLDRYHVAKQARGWLDFDDLILKTRDLLSDKQVAEWVLYKIDGGIDHILVDEAQDTSPLQWDVIEKLTVEFFSGTGSRADEDRTLFVVGDKKQSIYSFQGADPAALSDKSAHFQTKFTQAQKDFSTRSLTYSFRSASAVLRAVDQVFDPHVRPGFTEEKHNAFKQDLPGRVDLWPALPAEEELKARQWTDPVDQLSPQAAPVLLAEKIAAEIKRLTDPENPCYIPDDHKDHGTFKRPIQPGDFLILVQTRSTLFHEIIRACKAAHLPIAGADKLKVGEELAVRDIGALLAFLATPDDDLSLATALKSPLFGWSEQQLFSLAHGRGPAHLWQVLRQQEEAHPETLQMLHDLRAQTDFLRPYDLIERILTRHDGRARLLARLGPEAEDGINAMLAQALSYERNDVPSLTGFLEWMQSDDLEVKRQIDSSSNQIRVMTVHGAKGLEAPIVILPDTGQHAFRHRSEVLNVAGVPFWKSKADEMPSAMREAYEALKAADAQERLRLLYVAMTRAEKWLIIAGQGKMSSDGGDWYHILDQAMGHLTKIDLPEGDGVRYSELDWDALPVQQEGQITPKITALEPIFRTPAKAAQPAVEVLTPSGLGGAKALPGDAGADSDAAMAYGTLVHMLLENLPGLSLPEEMAFMQSIEQDWPTDILRQAVKETRRVLGMPDLAQIFAEGTLAEVPLTACIGNRHLHGTIDRLILRDDRILAVDFKTNRVVPRNPAECPDGILRQMGAYASALKQIYPHARVETAVLWTASPSLMRLPHDLVTQALARAADLDAPPAAS